MPYTFNSYQDGDTFIISVAPSMMTEIVLNGVELVEGNEWIEIEDCDIELKPGMVLSSTGLVEGTTIVDVDEKQSEVNVISTDDGAIHVDVDAPEKSCKILTISHPVRRSIKSSKVTATFEESSEELINLRVCMSEFKGNSVCRVILDNGMKTATTHLSA